MRCTICHRRIAASCPVHPGIAIDRASDAPPEWPGLDGLVPLTVLGRGGGGVVWGCLDDDRRVAVKIASGAHAARLAHEAAVMRRLGPPSTPRLLRSDDRAIVMEWLDGESLAARLATQPGDGRLSPDVAVSIASAIAARIDELHAAGIAHRDLKPENAWFEPTGNVRLLDLGLAAIAGGSATLTIAGTSTGTSHYMAPEQVLGESSGLAADIYSFAAIVFELLTGRPPFVGSEARIGHVSQRPPVVSEFGELAAFDAAIAACLAKDAGARPTSAGAVARQLAACTTTHVQRRRAVVQQGDTARAGGDVARARGDVAVARASVRCDVAVAAIARPVQLDVVAKAVTEVGGCVARVHRESIVLAFPGVPSSRGMEVARRLAATLGVSAVVRSAELVIRTGARIVLSGPALDDLRWAIETASTDRCVETVVTQPLAAPLIGRLALVDAVVEDIRACLATATPIVVTLCGQPGVGTTRILQEIAAALEPHATIAHSVTAIESPPVVDADVGGVPVGLGAESMPLVLAIDDGHRLDVDAHVDGAKSTPVGLIAESMPLVLAVDDGHRLDVDALDAIERATRAGTRRPVAVIVATHPALYDHRPLWAEHAAAFRRVAIEPLADADTDRLLLALLQPVDFVSEPVLARLRAFVQGVAGNAVEIVRQLREAGAIRRFRDADGWYLAHDVVNTPTPLAVQLVQRSLAARPPELRRLAQLAAILGDDITPARIDALRARHADQLDASVGLARLAALGILVESDGAWKLRHDLLRDALEATLSLGERAALHRDALDATLAPRANECGDARTVRSLAARARHATGAGMLADAALAHLDLAELARRDRHDVDAERSYSAALATLTDPALRGRALAGRGAIRYRLHRLAEAADDLAAARPLLDAHADLATQMDVRLEQATVADWRERWDEEAAFTEDAARLAAPQHAQRLLMARGRSAFRQGRLDEAVHLLRQATIGDDRETTVVAKLVFGMALVWAGDVDAARALFDEVIEECEAVGDRLHLCSALNDRLWVWFKSDAVDRAVDDQRRATEVARQLGHAHLERCSTYNLAELLYWRGDHDEARRLAERSRSLHDRFVGGSPLDALLQARIAVACDDTHAAQAALAWVDAECRCDGAVATQRDMIALALAEQCDTGAWNALLERTRATTVHYELAEALWFAARAATRAGDPISRAWIADGRASVAVGDRRWHERFDDLDVMNERNSHAA